MKKSLPVLFLRLEGIALLVFSIVAFSVADFSWWWLIIGFLVPDISMIGYLFGNKIGAWIYNAGHSLVIPLMLAGLSYANNSTILFCIVLIWIFHIGMDRAVGYGLKEVTSFQDTNLGKIGKQPRRDL